MIYFILMKIIEKKARIQLLYKIQTDKFVNLISSFLYFI